MTSSKIKNLVHQLATLTGVQNARIVVPLKAVDLFDALKSALRTISAQDRALLGAMFAGESVKSIAAKGKRNENAIRVAYWRICTKMDAALAGKSGKTTAETLSKNAKSVSGVCVCGTEIHRTGKAGRPRVWCTDCKPTGKIAKSKRYVLRAV